MCPGSSGGHLVIEVDGKDETVWKLTNNDLPSQPINDACAVHRHITATKHDGR
jgi:hypothetical protein